MGRGQFRLRFGDIHLTVGTPFVQGVDEIEILFAEFNCFRHHVPVEISGAYRKIGLRHIGLKGEEDVLVGGGAGLGLFARGPERAPDPPPQVNFVA